jgi:F-type H+-transporting ATPase subunit a
LIQAFIFALLTILYFSQSMELDHDDDHAGDGEKADDQTKQEAHN